MTTNIGRHLSQRFSQLNNRHIPTQLTLKSDEW